ncbi:MAG: pseudouridine synthase [Candidatus Bathyarchaeota archaeon]|nr:pseudouridine synthase [Candidatus Bathyarchaeota archaeon]
MNKDLERLRAIADYQFERGAGATLFPDNTNVEYSRKTGRPRHISIEGELVANYRPNDALFTLTIAGARRLVENLDGRRYTVQALDDVVEFVEQGKNLFAKHVVDADESLRAGQEVIVMDSKKTVVAVGKAMLNKKEMLAFKTGVAVKVRRGRKRHR